MIGNALNFRLFRRRRHALLSAARQRAIEEGVLWMRRHLSAAGVDRLSDMTDKQLTALLAGK